MSAPSPEVSVESWLEPKASGHSEVVFLPAGAGTCQRYLLDFLAFSVSTSERTLLFSSPQKRAGCLEEALSPQDF